MDPQPPNPRLDAHAAGLWLAFVEIQDENDALETESVCVCLVGAGEKTIKHTLLWEASVRELGSSRAQTSVTPKSKRQLFCFTT